MSSKEYILNSIRDHITTRCDMPPMDIKGIQYNDVVSAFMDVSKKVGGQAVELGEKDINLLIRQLYPEAKAIASNLATITIANVNPDEVEMPHQLQNLDLAIVKGELAVAENGCVWVPQNLRHKLTYFIAEYLVILVDKQKIVHNMHEAYQQIRFNEFGFGVFISGPSKTADIEQSLVVGAHGARGVTVILVDQNI